jgi:hypothetical protein
MAARAWAPVLPTDEVHFRNDVVSLCLLLNRRSRTLRIFDFRAGPSPTKSTFVMSVARRENMQRVFIVVEREEISTWSRLGLRREGVIPGFYKRSDAYVLGASVDPNHSDSQRLRADRPRAAQAQDSAAHAESTLRAARRIACKERALGPRPGQLKLVQASEADVRSAQDAANRAGTALGSWEPFGRDSQRVQYLGALRGSPVFMLSVEVQPCFDHALVEWLTAPRDVYERSLFRAGLDQICRMLLDRGIVSVFCMSPIDDPGLASVYVGCGFRRTGLLGDHMVVRQARRDAFLWTRKHAVAGDPEADE